MAKYEMVEVKDQAGREIVKMMNVGALRISTFAQDPEEIADRINNVVNLPLRDDDVMFCSAPKSGTIIFGGIADIVFSNGIHQ